MSRTLKPSRLGRAGESTFALLCDQSELTCNKSNPDETGWDFVVEFPLDEPSSNITLDNRQPLACLVQLKSTAAGRDSRVSIRLSAIERLAKDLRPALIVVLLLHANGTSIAGYAIHLLGEELGRVLKQLRIAHAKKSWDINHASITFDYRQRGRQFEVTADGLRDVMTKACGTDPSHYMLEKQSQLAELGYEDGKYLTEALIWVEGPQHLNNMLLGLEPMRPKRLQVYDTRFGIHIPYHDPQFAHIKHIHIQPPTLGDCQVLIRGQALSSPAVYPAQAYIGPPIPEIGGAQLLIRHPDFTLRLTSGRLEFQTLGDFDATTRDLARWIELLRGLSYLSSGHGSITIQNLPRFPRLTLSAEQAVNGPYVEQLPQLLQFLDGWQRLLNMAGVKSTGGFTIEEIWAARSAISAVDALVYSARNSYFEFQSLGDDQIADDDVQALYFNSAQLADATVSFAAKVTLKRTNDALWQYRSTTVEVLDVREMVDDLKEYGMDQAKARDLRILIDPSHLTFIPIKGVQPVLQAQES